jgi:Mn-dependent DtxR family transcriptional regulator
MVRLDHFDREIIHFLGNRGDSNTNEISENLKISWATSQIHLKKLVRMGYVSSYKTNKIITWKLNYND